MTYMAFNADKAAAAQAELKKSVLNLRAQKAITRTSLKEGRGAKTDARMAGYEIPFSKNVPHGSTALNPLAGTTSFNAMVPAQIDKMYVGLAYGGFTVEWEHFTDMDARAGNSPKDRFEQRDDVMRTYLQEQNWYSIGNGSGALAVVTVGGGSGTITCAYDNTARGRSKGSIRLAVSPSTASARRILYQSISTAGAVTAEFYITSKASATTFVAVVLSGAIGAADIIVKKGHYNLVPYGLGYHNDDDAARYYQGAPTASLPFIRATAVDGAGGAPTPTLIDNLKLTCQAKANDLGANNRRVCRLTPANYRTLGAFGYELRQETGDAMTTYGLPQYYKDGDTDFITDMDFEDCEIHMNDRKSLFYYVAQELRELSPGEQQYVGTNLVGSTERYQNWGEASNLVWDGRGDDGQGEAGSPNSACYIEGLEMPSTTQVSLGISLV